MNFKPLALAVNEIVVGAPINPAKAVAAEFDTTTLGEACFIDILLFALLDKCFPLKSIQSCESTDSASTAGE